MRRNLRRVARPPQQQPAAEPYTFVSPVNGWVTNTNLSQALKAAALVLDNWFPTSTGIRLRGGSEQFATIGSDPVTSLFNYVSGGTRKLFAADSGSIWDISGTPSEEVTGQTDGYYASRQFETAGGDFLYAVNGADLAQLYDGTSWAAIDAASSPISITGVTTDKFIHVWVYRSRLYFIERNSLRVWYLPLDSVGGAAQTFTLAGVFQKGGSLVFGGTWSVDAGTGTDDKCIFVSSEGEVAIYQGSDPGASSSDVDPWRLNGRYDISAPMGKNATMSAGGDFLIATRDGLVPLSQAIYKEPAELSLAAASVNIEPDWRKEATARVDLPWDMVRWSEGNMAIIALPVVGASSLPCCFVRNLETGKWARFTGWDTRCVAVHNGNAYFGTSDGRIMQCESGGQDGDMPYTCSYAGHFDHLRAIGEGKIVQTVRSTFQASRPFSPQMSASVNYAQRFPAPPSALSDSGDTDSAWDSGKWDSAVWDGTAQQTVITRWTSIASNGFAFSPQIQVTCGNDARPDAILMTYDCLVQKGGFVN